MNILRHSEPSAFPFFINGTGQHYSNWTAGRSEIARTSSWMVLQKVPNPTPDDVSITGANKRCNHQKARLLPRSGLSTLFGSPWRNFHRFGGRKLPLGNCRKLLLDGTATGTKPQARLRQQNWRQKHFYNENTICLPQKGLLRFFGPAQKHFDLIWGPLGNCQKLLLDGTATATKSHPRQCLQPSRQKIR